MAADTEYGRDFLEGLVDEYLNALVARDPGQLPLADDVFFAENQREIDLGDGLWRTATGLGEYRHVICDPERNEVAVITVVEEQGSPIILDLRLAHEGGELTEIETMAIRSNGGAYEDLGAPADEYRETVPPEDRVSRERLIELANMYFDGLEYNDPDDDYSFIHPECDRWEQGLLTTNRDEGIIYGHVRDTDFTELPCREQLETGFLGFITRIRDRRFVVDEARQTVIGFCAFDHNGTVREVPTMGDEASTVPPYFSTPRTLPVAEVFRIKDDMVYLISAEMNESPYGTQPPFPTGDDWIEDRDIAKEIAVEPSDEPCDRDDLEYIVDGFREGLVENDASRLPVAPSVEYTENGQRLPLNDGLWQTVTEMGDYDIRFADPDAGTVTFQGTLVEHDVPGVLTARLQVDRQRVTEIEAVIVRRELAEDGVENTQTMMLPMLPYQNEPDAFDGVDAVLGRKVNAGRSAAAMPDITDTYYEGVRGNGVDHDRFADDCVRRINGVRVTERDDTSGPLSLSCAEQLESGWFDDIEAVRETRPWLVDQDRGTVVRSVLFDLPNDGEGLPHHATEFGRDRTSTTEDPAPGDDDGFGGTYESFSGPYSMLAVQFFGIEEGRIQHIEEQQRTVPYKASSGWD